MQCCKRRSLIFIIPVVLVVLAVISLSVYVLLLYHGASMTVAPGDVRLLSQRISTFFCQEEKIQLSSSDRSTHFTASVVPGDKLNDKTDQTVRINVAPTLNAVNGRVFWRFFLPSGSRIDVLQCTTDTSGNSVMGFIYKGHDIDEDCIKHVSYESIHDNINLRNSDKSCTDVILRRYLVRHCGGSRQRMDATTSEEDYYLVIYDSDSSITTQVIANISITRLTYDRHSALANCSSNDSCTLPLRFWSSDTVIGEVAMTPEEREVTLEWFCIPRSASFASIFAGIPLFLFFVILSSCYCVHRKRQQKNTSVSQAQLVNEENERNPLIEEAEIQPAVSAAQSYGACIAETHPPLCSKIESLHRPYPYIPSAPPDLPPEVSPPSDEEQPFAFPRQPPPTYEESVRTKPKKQRQAEMV